jgi:glycosyltransferase involved in cell wall biosynthesis
LSTSSRGLLEFPFVLTPEEATAEPPLGARDTGTSVQQAILFVHHRAQISGAARSLAELIARLGDEWEPHVLTPPGPAAELFGRAGANVTTAPVALFQHTWDSPYAGRKWLLLARELVALGPHLAAVRRLLREHDFAVVHLNDSPLIAAAVIAKRKGVPVVWHLRSALSGRGHVLPHLVRRALERSGDRAIAIDADVAASFDLRIPTYVIFNSAEVPSVRPSKPEARNTLGLPEAPVLIGFIGNLRRIKGWPEFVEAAAGLRDEPAHFVVLGSGVRPPVFFQTVYGRLVAALRLATDDESEMRRLVAAQGLDDRFTFLPFADDVGTVYAALDVVTFPNQGEGLGRPVLEAAAYGVPVVASGSPGGAGILLPEKTGILLDDAAPASLQAALRRLVGNRELRTRLGSAGRDHARAHFDPAKNAADLRDVYWGLTRPNPASR